jgi:hypothetical protein
MYKTSQITTQAIIATYMVTDSKEGGINQIYISSFIIVIHSIIYFRNICVIDTISFVIKLFSYFQGLIDSLVECGKRIK